MRFIAVGLIGLLFDMMILLDEARHVLSHYQAERNQVLDLLHDYLLHHQLHHSKKVIVPSPAEDGFATAHLFRGSNRSVEASGAMLLAVKASFEESKSFTVIAAFKQERRNVGSILSLGTERDRFLEIESSGWRHELRFHYMHRSRRRTETFPSDIADNRWHRLAVSVSGGTHLNVFIDCQLVFQRNIPQLNLDLTSSSSSSSSSADEEKLHLWIGQRNTRHVHFKGAMEYLKIVTSDTGYMEQCPEANVACPSCSQFQQLQLTVQQLQSVVFELTKQVEHANRKIIELEKCDCRKKCEVEGVTYRDGEDIPSDERCSLCTCKNGEVVCKPLQCEDTICKHPVIQENGCCPVCLKQCVIKLGSESKSLEHGEEFQPKPCTRYFCNNGNLTREHQQRKSCPRLSCPKPKQIKRENDCCKICSDTNWCLNNSHLCPANSKCQSLETNFTCSCDQGFKHVGKLCQDVDECRSIGGKDGHHCRLNSRCVNLNGSYCCERLSGNTEDHADEPFLCESSNRNCEEIERDRCSSHARCIKTVTSFTCECEDGFEGDGFKCSPICREPCQNEGTCVDVGRCSCRLGYRGRNCDTDVDECIEGISSCHPNSVCVNIPGSYYCQCKDGYYSSRLDNERGLLCRDLDECQGWGGGQHCPDSAVCHNSNGSYECLCLGNASCSLGCSVDGQVHRDGETWQPNKDLCLECQCKDGKVSCENKLIKCDDDDDGICCKSRNTCRHQDLPVNYTTGQKWLYHCSSCQCSGGEIDCWPMECPKLACSEVVYNGDECCPRCLLPDPCNAESHGISKSAACLFKGQIVQHQQILPLDSLNCSVCQCLNGNICCSYDQVCARNTNVTRLPSHQEPRNTTETSRSSRPRARTRHEEWQTEENG